MVQSALEYIRTVENLRDVWREFTGRGGIKSSAGVDGVTPAMLRDDLGRRLSRISEEMKNGYEFSSLRGVVLPKKEPGKTRLICVPTVADRLVQRAILRKVEARSVQLGIANDVSFGFVRLPTGEKRGTHAARQAAIKLRVSSPWLLKADISAFFDTIHRPALIEGLASKFRLRSLQSLLRGVINCEVHVNNDRVRKSVADNKICKGAGLRQGMPLSPILSNFVLRDFDAVVGFERAMVRYADDMLVFCNSRTECEDAKALVDDELRKVKLSLSVPKTKICEPDESVDFLGMELGKSKDGVGYSLVVSHEQMKEIRTSFTSLHDWQDAQHQKMDVRDLLTRLEQMKRGYLTAYGSAENKALLAEKLNQWVSNCASKIYGSIFGNDKVATLTKEQRRFLMLP